MPAYTKQERKHAGAGGEIELAPLPKPKPPRFTTPIVDMPGEGGAAFDFEVFTGPKRPGIPWKSILFVLVMSGVLFGFSSKSDYLLGQLAAPLLCLGALHGLWRGGFRKIVMLAVTILMFAFVSGYAHVFAPVTRTAGGSSAGLNFLISLAVAIVGLVVAGFIVRRIRNRVILRRPILVVIDRFVGAGVGMAEAALVVLTVCWTTVEIAPHAAAVRDQRSVTVGSFRQVFAAGVVDFASEASEGPVGEVVEATNPFWRFPDLRLAIHNYFETGSIDPSTLDPETVNRLNELLKDTPIGDIGGLQEVLKKYEGNAETYDDVRRQLPTAAEVGQ